MSNLCYLDNHQLIVSFPYDADLIDRIKQLPQPNRKYDRDKQSWVVMLSRYGKVNELALKEFEQFLKDNDFKIHVAVRNYLTELDEKIKTQKYSDEKSIEDSIAGDSSLEVQGLGGELRPFQRAGVSYMTERKRVLLGDEMGLGKTVQGIAAVCHAKAFPCLVICPVSLQLNWLREIEKWAVDKRVTMEVEESADFTVIPYSQVVKHENILKKGTHWQALICDESHYVKNSKAQRTKVVKSIAKGIPNIYLLSGTPIVNRPAEFITQLQILDRLNEMGGWKHFTDRYCAAKQERFGLNINGASNLTELNSRLRASCYIRRFKKDVLKELPDKQRSVIEVPISNRKEYESTRKEVREELAELKNKSKEFTQDVLKEVANYKLEQVQEKWRELFTEEKVPSAETSSKLKRLLHARLLRRESFIENSEGILLLNKLKIRSMQGKLKAAVEWIEHFLESGEKLVIFCDHIEAQEAIYNKLAKKSTAIMSHMDTETRQKSVDRFQKEKKIQAIVCSLGAAGVGFTMTASSNVLFIEQGWTPAIHDQAEDRTHRIGQKNAVTAYYMLGKDTIDGDIYGLIEKKRAIVSAASDGIEGEDISVVRLLIDQLASERV